MRPVGCLRVASTFDTSSFEPRLLPLLMMLVRLLSPPMATDADGAGVLSLWEWVHLYKVLSATRAAFSRADTYTTAQLTW